MQKKKIFFHLGLPKCGSKTIQKFLNINQDSFEANNVCLPITRNIIPGDEKNIYYNNKHLALAIRDPDISKENVYKAKKWMKHSSNLRIDCNLWTNLITNFAQSKYQTLVISSELFGLNPSYYDFSKISHLFSDYDLCYVIFIRRLDRWLESRYCQAIKGASRQKCYFNDFPVFRNFKKLSFYKDILYIQQNYPMGKIKIASVDDLNTELPITNQFLKMVELDNIQAGNFKIPESENISLSPDYYAFFRLLNIIDINDDIFWKITNGLSRHYKPDTSSSINRAPLLMELKDRKRVINHYKHDCEKINKAFSLDIKLDNFNLYEGKLADKMEISKQGALKILDHYKPDKDISVNDLGVIKDKIIKQLSNNN